MRSHGQPSANNVRGVARTLAPSLLRLPERQDRLRVARECQVLALEVDRCCIRSVVIISTERSEGIDSGESGAEATRRSPVFAAVWFSARLSQFIVRRRPMRVGLDGFLLVWGCDPVLAEIVLR